MKRYFAFFLSILLLCGAFAGCSGDSQPSSSLESSSSSASDSSVTPAPEPVELPALSLCVDISSAEFRDVRSFLEGVPGFGREFNVEYELLSNDQSERGNQITRIRTEIMAGKGPDVFICYTPLFESAGDFLFRYPGKSMLNRIFLPLDDYIAEAQYMKMDELLPAVMEAGKSKEG